MAKKGSANPNAGDTKAQAGSAAAADKSQNKGQANISDQLRQAVKDLGGDDDDLELIQGVDSDDEAPASKAKSGQEKSLDDVSDDAAPLPS